MGGLAEQVLLLPFGERPVVQVFGVRMVLEGTLEDGRLYPIVVDRPAARAAIAGKEPRLWIRAGGLKDGRGVDLGSAFEEVAYVGRSDRQAAATGKRRGRAVSIDTGA